MTSKIDKLREDVAFMVSTGGTYNITTYNVSSEDVWGRNKTGTDSTEDLFIVEKIEGEELRREGQKEIVYYIVLANYSSSLTLGDKVVISGRDCWVRTIQPAYYKNQVFAKRITLVSEEWR